jgi:hypothetical protein
MKTLKIGIASYRLHPANAGAFGRKCPINPSHSDCT